MISQSIRSAVVTTNDGEVWPQYTADLLAYQERVRFDRKRLADYRDLVHESINGPSPPPERSVLEIGAAPYILTAELLRSGFNVTATGLPFNDATEGKVTIDSEEALYEIPLHLFDAETRWPFPDESFDVVVAGEVFEHLYRQPWVLFHEAHRVLKVDGALVLSTPNGHALEVLYNWLRRGSTGLGFNPGAPSARHAREYSVEELRDLAWSSAFISEQLFTRSYMHIDLGGFPGRLGGIKRRIYEFAKARAEGGGGLLGNRGETIFLVARRSARAVGEPPTFMRYAMGDPSKGYNFE